MLPLTRENVSFPQARVAVCRYQSTGQSEGFAFGTGHIDANDINPYKCINVMICKELKIPTTITSGLAYLCGVFAGDGSISIRSEKYEYSLKCVGNPADEKEFYLQIIKSIFKRVFGHALEIRPFDKKKTFGFRVFSKELVVYLTEVIGLPRGRKYDSLDIPAVFFRDENLLLSFIRGVFDTDGCISFKRKYKIVPYYPVISLSSRSSVFIKSISSVLKDLGFKVSELYDYRLNDIRANNGFTVISRIDLNGQKNLRLWMEKIGFSSPKHLDKIRKNWKEK
jgi:hypothetical protein